MDAPIKSGHDVLCCTVMRGLDPRIHLSFLCHITIHRIDVLYRTRREIWT